MMTCCQSSTAALSILGVLLSNSSLMSCLVPDARLLPRRNTQQKMFLGERSLEERRGGFTRLSRMLNFDDLKSTGFTDGLSWKGDVEATYDQLVRAFGAPAHGPDDLRGGDNKVSCEFVLKFDDGTIATVHDWKEPRTRIDGKTVRSETIEWSVGGFTTDAVNHVIRVLDLLDAADAGQ